MVMLACLGSLAVSAQIVQKVGNNSMTISQSAAFEIESTDRGFLPPRLTDAQLAGITSPAVGLFVFNTTSAVLQYFNGIRWISLIDAANSAYVTAYDCSIGSAGTLTSGTPASGVTQTIKASVAKLGTYSITTAPVNGVTFSGSGVYTVTGDQNIVLTATGTPTTIGAITNALSGTPTCSFSRMIIDGTSAVTSYACGTASAGSMIPGTPVSGVTQTITAAVSRVGPYSITTTAINGVTFTASGTYPTTGQQNITLTASGTPTVSGTFTYDISGATTCSFSRVVSDPAGAASYADNVSAGAMTINTPVTGVTETITATVTKIGTYSISIVNNGVTFSGSGNYGAIGAQSVVLTASGTPTAVGSFNYAITSSPSFTFSRTATAVPSTITSTGTGRVWMDRNLGATQAATSSTDYLAYGDLYQWGRKADGHQLMNWTSATAGSPANAGVSGTSSTATVTTNSINFIASGANPWYTGSNPSLGNLWQGVNGINNPCPSGFRLPTSAEVDLERSKFSTADAAGAFTALKLQRMGYRSYFNGVLQNGGADGDYWTSTISGSNATILEFGTYSATPRMSGASVSLGYSVRCIQN